MKTGGKGYTEGTIGVLVGIIIAIIVLYVMWRIYGGGETKTAAHIIAGMLGH
jgi:hypothetical protein